MSIRRLNWEGEDAEDYVGAGIKQGDSEVWDKKYREVDGVEIQTRHDPGSGITRVNVESEEGEERVRVTEFIPEYKRGMIPAFRIVDETGVATDNLFLNEVSPPVNVPVPGMSFNDLVPSSETVTTDKIRVGYADYATELGGVRYDLKVATGNLNFQNTPFNEYLLTFDEFDHLRIQETTVKKATRYREAIPNNPILWIGDPLLVRYGTTKTDIGHDAQLGDVPFIDWPYWLMPRGGVTDFGTASLPFTMGDQFSPLFTNGAYRGSRHYTLGGCVLSSSKWIVLYNVQPVVVGGTGWDTDNRKAYVNIAGTEIRVGDFKTANPLTLRIYDFGGETWYLYSVLHNSVADPTNRISYFMTKVNSSGTSTIQSEAYAVEGFGSGATVYTDGIADAGRDDVPSGESVAWHTIEFGDTTHRLNGDFYLANVGPYFAGETEVVIEE
jgi:hypothetical protein